MSRAGRKRKLNASRYPNGQVHKPIHDSPRLVAMAMPHRKSLRENLQLDQRAESQLGRMRLRGQISESQFLAGARFSKVVGAYMATITPPSQLGGRGRALDCGGLCEVPEPGKINQDCLCARRRVAYMAAFDHLMAIAGHRGAVAVKTVVCHNEPCPAYLCSALGWGLSALSQHFGIGKRGDE